MSDITSPELQSLAACLSDWRTTTSISIASTVLFLFDYFLTFSDEMRFMWWPKARIGNILFFLARYPAFAGTIIVLLPTSVSLGNVSTCIRLITIVSSERAYQPIIRTMTPAPVQVLRVLIDTGVFTYLFPVILAVRVWGIWERKRWVVGFLVVLALACLIPAIIVVEKDIVSSSWSPTVAPQLASVKQCQIVVSSIKRLWVLPYLLTIVFELVTLSLTSIKIGPWRRTALDSPLLDVLWQDGIMYYIFMLGLGIVNIGLVLQVGSPQLRSGGTQLQTCFHSILATRMVLRLAGSYSKGLTSTSCMSNSGGNIEFTTGNSVALDDMSGSNSNTPQEGNEGV